MMTLFGRLRTSSFLRQNAIVLTGSVLVGVGNYIYYPVLGRMLEPASFGEVQALAALFAQLLLFLVVLGQVTVNIVANYTDETKQQKVLFELEKFAFMVSLGLLVVLSACSWQLKEFFQFESPLPFIILLLALVVSVPVTFRGSYLRAHKRFTSFSIAQILGAFGKVALSALLVMAGFKSAGAMGGIVLAQILVLGYAAYKAKQLGFFRPADGRYIGRPEMSILGPELKYAALVLLGSLAVAVLSSLDVFVVKHYFDPHTAGEYAGISTVAKIIFFLTASVTQVLLPSVKLRNKKSENRLLFLKSLTLVVALGGAVWAIFSAFSHLIVRSLMGGDYTTYSNLLPRLSLVMFLLSILSLVISYYLALRNYQQSVIILTGLALVGWLMLTHHQSLEAIVNNLMYGSVAMLGMFAIWQSISLTGSRRRG